MLPVVVLVVKAINMAISKGMSYAMEGVMTPPQQKSFEKYFDDTVRAVKLTNAMHIDAKRRIFGKKKRDGLLWHGAAGGETSKEILKGLVYSGVGKLGQLYAQKAVLDFYGNKWGVNDTNKQIKKEEALLALAAKNAPKNGMNTSSSKTPLLIGASVAGLIIIMLIMRGKK